MFFPEQPPVCGGDRYDTNSMEIQILTLMNQYSLSPRSILDRAESSFQTIDKCSCTMNDRSVAWIAVHSLLSTSTAVALRQQVSAVGSPHRGEPGNTLVRFDVVLYPALGY